MRLFCNGKRCMVCDDGCGGGAAAKAEREEEQDHAKGRGG